MSVQQLASATAQAYTTGNNLTISGPARYVASNVVTPGVKTAKLLFTVRLLSSDAAAVMYLRSGADNGEVLSGIALVPGRWYTFEMAWDPDRAFSVRFGTNTTVQDLIISAALTAA